MGVDMQLVMPPPPQFYYTVALEIAVPAAQMINDGVAEFVAQASGPLHPDRHACRCRTATRRPRNSSAA